MSRKDGFWHSTYPLADRYKMKNKTDQNLDNN